ncbi:aspartyl-phosphate phosphatase Spo0E family protein [Paenibacillus bouchesdurhonensis]|uniref:aspartyl-phosphate phosphatase Spo0E family protein n=1 Tax=Paenibacillus bouchesdurhonensis TaxID=1870990 RepID=UPI000FA83101|nr:aspartyl-phosphate phosphatase Spo0E family protein [Paenibacillus bouchesdurhonensis]
MFCGEYNMPYTYKLTGGHIAEGNETNQWMDEEGRRTSPQALTLEDEIQQLRTRMEEIFLVEKSFTSDIVIEISSLLDLKINEFMKSQKVK